ncbi:MAG: NADH-quinone oxidoreductase subunit C [bacterium]|nr:NADH-quinone oxidoreductase subunit C [bacterium]
MEQKAIYEMLAEHLGEGALEFNEEGVEAFAKIDPAKIAAAGLFLRDNEQLRFNQLMCLSGIDWDGLDENGKGKSVAILGYTGEGVPETSDRVAEGDFGVAYHLYSHELKHKFSMRVRVSREVACVPTVSSVWSTANWHEREAWDLVGIRFEGHPNLKRMLLDEAWEGHPLRKDYEMPSQWQTVKLSGENLISQGSPAANKEPGEE